MQIKNNKGLTIIEVLVSVSILSVLVGGVIFSYRNSNDRLSLNGATQEVAIAIRQAQVYGLAVREDAPGGTNFGYGYGVYFNPVAGQDSSFYLFVDKNSNNTYDNGSGCGSTPTECVERFDLKNGVTIDGVCNGAGTCYSTSFAALHVKFMRPDSLARLALVDNLGTVTFQTISASIKIISPNGSLATIVVGRNGSIEVQ